MALHMNLMVNGHRIGYLAIQRREPGRPAPDDICHYDWQIELNGFECKNPPRRPVAHRYGDGAWELVARTIEASGCWPTPVPEETTNGNL